MTLHDTRTDLLALVPKGARIAELGVFQGAFAAEILTRCRPSALHLVDLWEGYQSSGDKDGQNIRRVDMPKEFERLQKLYAGVGAVTLHRSSIMQYLGEADDDSLDMVYIDGDHTYQNVHEEIHAAARVVTAGGWIMGHDMNLGGVRYAVYEFCENTGNHVSHVATDGCQSYAIKLHKTSHDSA